MEFREQDMPAIAQMLEEQRLPAYPDGYVVKLLESNVLFPMAGRLERQDA